MVAKPNWAKKTFGDVLGHKLKKTLSYMATHMNSSIQFSFKSQTKKPNQPYMVINPN